jgi:hypothetical protein
MAAKLKDKTDIDHHGPKYILIICHLPDPPTFSLPTTFKVMYILFYSVCFLYCTGNINKHRDLEVRDVKGRPNLHIVLYSQAPMFHLILCLNHMVKLHEAADRGGPMWRSIYLFYCTAPVRNEIL